MERERLPDISGELLILSIYEGTMDFPQHLDTLFLPSHPPPLAMEIMFGKSDSSADKLVCELWGRLTSKVNSDCYRASWQYAVCPSDA